MSHPVRLGLTPPDWLVRNLRPSPAPPVNRPAVVRAAVSLTLPLAIGLAVGRPEYGALASMGALSGVISDTADAYRMRLLHIAVPQVFSAVGITVGSLVYGQEWVAVGVLTAIALVSGMISTIGAVASISGLLLLLNSVIGAGLPLPGDWWLPPALFSGGGLFVLVLALLGWPLRAGVPERAAVADTYRKVADGLAAASGTAEAYDEARRAVTQSLNQSYDLVLSRRARHHGRSPELVRLLAQLNALTPLVEAAPAVRLSVRALPDEIPVAVRHLADAVETGYSGPLGLRLPEPGSGIGKAVDQALRHAADVVGERSPDALAGAANSVDRREWYAPLRVRAVRGARDVALSVGSWRYGLRLALCVGLAQTLVALVPVPRSYWIALTITFVLKPDFGSVFSRALLRALGTVVGLMVAAAVLANVERGWWDVLVMLLLAPLIPVFTPRGYGYQTAAITPVILLLSDILNHQGTALLLPRLVDSLIGCGIALVAGYLLWPESWHARVGDRLADAVADTARYVEQAFGNGDPRAPDGRARLRRRLYRDLSAIRTEFQRALTEPPPVGRRAAGWWPLVVAVERIVDATTAARVRIKQGAEPPSAAEVGQVALELRELAKGLRETDVLYAVRSDLGGPPESVLEPLRQEVAAARAITSPR